MILHEQPGKFHLQPLALCIFRQAGRCTSDLAQPAAISYTPSSSTQVNHVGTLCTMMASIGITSLSPKAHSQPKVPQSAALPNVPAFLLAAYLRS